MWLEQLAVPSSPTLMLPLMSVSTSSLMVKCHLAPIILGTYPTHLRQGALSYNSISYCLFWPKEDSHH